MRNAALPRDLAHSTEVPPAVARPLPLRSFWRSRRRQAAAPPPPPPSPPALLRRLHVAASAVPTHPTPDHPVLVHDFSISAVELRSRLPLCVCDHYDLHSENHGPMFRGSRVRVTGCRREPGGLYAIDAEICR